jgi:hypothetical protein
VRVFGRGLFEVSTELDDAPTQPRLESTSGGQFEFGYQTPRPGVVECRERR